MSQYTQLLILKAKRAQMPVHVKKNSKSTHDGSDDDINS